MENNFLNRLENCHKRLIKIRDGIKSIPDKSEETISMLSIAERIILISTQILKDMHEKKRWDMNDRTGFKRFLMECENFIKLNIELLLPRHL